MKVLCYNISHIKCVDGIMPLIFFCREAVVGANRYGELGVQSPSGAELPKTKVRSYGSPVIMTTRFIKTFKSGNLCNMGGTADII